VKADVGAIIGFKMIVFPGNDDGLLWAAGLLGQARSSPVPPETTADTEGRWGHAFQKGLGAFRIRLVAGRGGMRAIFVVLQIRRDFGGIHCL